MLELACALVLAAAPPAPPEPVPLGHGAYAIRFATMGTLAELEVEAPDAATAHAAGVAAQAELARIEAVMSEWRPETPLSQVNAAAGVRPVEVPEELYRVIERSLDVARRSGGAFDPSWAGMRGVWKFGDGMDGTVPDDATIERTRALVDWRRVRLDAKRRTVFLERRGMALGLGGIAKGYAVDRVVAKLRGLGLSDFTVKVGGDLFAAGRKGGLRPWQVGIRDPRDERRVIASVPIEDRAFSTSGDYERFFVKDGVRYHHIIDPSTGRPATRSRSVTARCKDAYTADAVTKPVFILGPERGIPLAAELGCDVVIVDAEGELHASPALAPP